MRNRILKEGLVMLGITVIPAAIGAYLDSSKIIENKSVFRNTENSCVVYTTKGIEGGLGYIDFENNGLLDSVYSLSRTPASSSFGLEINEYHKKEFQAIIEAYKHQIKTNK
jgi:hypothetical protein